ncbi:hypothetical protein MUP59_04605 [Candidatus Bathyarchaeota archaeon]|nr:hypothetical protein [Candidatus Bathyarchaeota archaeon]
MLFERWRKPIFWVVLVEPTFVVTIRHGRRSYILDIQPILHRRHLTDLFPAATLFVQARSAVRQMAKSYHVGLALLDSFLC